MVSDALNHTKQSAYSYMSCIFKYLKENYPVCFFLMAQRSSLIISNKYLWEREFDFVLEWSYFTW